MAYHTPDDTPDGQWITSVPTEPGVENTADIVVSGLRDRSLIKPPSHGTVYWYQNAKRYGIISREIVESMGAVPGWDLNQITVVPLDRLNEIQRGPDFIEASSRSDGLLIRDRSTGAVYLLENGERRHITTPEVFALKGYDWDDVIEVTPSVADLPEGPAITINPTGRILGRVIHDENANGQGEPNEDLVKRPDLDCSGLPVPGVSISWSGPTSNSASINQCLSRRPYFDIGPLEAATYALTINLPDGWRASGPGEQTVTVAPDQTAFPRFYITKISDTNPPPEGVPRLSLSKTDFCVGDEWTLTVSNSAPDSAVFLSAWRDGQPYLSDFYLGNTDSDGRLMKSDMFPKGTEGSWLESVSVGGQVSNQISFNIADCSDGANPIIALDKANYCVGETWKLTVRGQPNSDVDLYGISNGSPWGPAKNWGHTDENGFFEAPEGTMGPEAVGEYSLWVEIASNRSNHVSFSVSPCAIAPPEITSIDPDPVRPDVQTWLTVTGRGFQPGFEADVIVQSETYSITSPGLEYVSPSKIRVSVRMAGQAVSYTAILRIANTDGQSAVRAFSVKAIETAEDFSLFVSPATHTIRQGESASYGIRVESQNGFSQKLSLAVSGLPSGLRSEPEITPSSVTPRPDGSATATLAISTDRSTQTGSFRFEITAASNGEVKTAFADLSVVGSSILRITSVAPDLVPPDVETWLTVRGANFQAGSTAEVSVGNETYQITPAGVQFISGSELRISVKMVGQANRYPATLRITNPDGQSATHGFTVEKRTAPSSAVDPHLTSSPTSPKTSR